LPLGKVLRRSCCGWASSAPSAPPPWCREGSGGSGFVAGRQDCGVRRGR